MVVKVGSSLFCSGRDGFDAGLFDVIVREIASLAAEGREVVIVSSGAIALGMSILRLAARPRELPYLQAAAAVGQNALMDNYSRVFQKAGVSCAQILLTWDDFNDRTRYLNAKNTLYTLFKLKAIPVINENDTVSTQEIRFGDNDQLSARVATLVSADLLIMLSDVDGLLDAQKAVVRRVEAITPEIRRLACPTDKKTCVGGMITKLEAAQIAVDAGIPCVIANGRDRKAITAAAADPLGPGTWTVFLPGSKGLAARQRWIAFGTKPKGTIVIDKGAAAALAANKSLLSVGVVDVEGSFEAGEIASVVTPEGTRVAIGKAGLSSRKLREVKGTRCDKEVMHRNDLVIV